MIDIINELTSFGAKVEVYDPWVDQNEAATTYNVAMIQELPRQRYDAVVLAVAHQEFVQLTEPELRATCRTNAVIYDVKHVLPTGVADGTL